MANRERSNSFNTIKYFILNATTYLTNTVWFYKEIRKNYIENELNEQERADKALTLYAELLFKIKTTQFTENDICNIQ